MPELIGDAPAGRRFSIAGVQRSTTQLSPEKNIDPVCGALEGDGVELGGRQPHEAFLRDLGRVDVKGGHLEIARGRAAGRENIFDTLQGAGTSDVETGEISPPASPSALPVDVAVLEPEPEPEFVLTPSGLQARLCPLESVRSSSSNGELAPLVRQAESSSSGRAPQSSGTLEKNGLQHKGFDAADKKTILLLDATFATSNSIDLAWELKNGAKKYKFDADVQAYLDANDDVLKIAKEFIEACTIVAVDGDSNLFRLKLATVSGDSDGGFHISPPAGVVDARLDSMDSLSLSPSSDATPRAGSPERADGAPRIDLFRKERTRHSPMQLLSPEADLGLKHVSASLMNRPVRFLDPKACVGEAKRLMETALDDRAGGCAEPRWLEAGWQKIREMQWFSSKLSVSKEKLVRFEGMDDPNPAAVERFKSLKSAAQRGAVACFKGFVVEVIQGYEQESIYGAGTDKKLPFAPINDLQNVRALYGERPLTKAIPRNEVRPWCSKGKNLGIATLLKTWRDEAGEKLQTLEETKECARVEAEEWATLINVCSKVSSLEEITEEFAKIERGNGPLAEGEKERIAAIEEKKALRAAANDAIKASVFGQAQESAYVSWERLISGCGYLNLDSLSDTAGQLLMETMTAEQSTVDSSLEYKDRMEELLGVMKDEEKSGLHRQIALRGAIASYKAFIMTIAHAHILGKSKKQVPNNLVNELTSIRYAYQEWVPQNWKPPGYQREALTEYYPNRQQKLSSKLCVWKGRKMHEDLPAIVTDAKNEMDAWCHLLAQRFDEQDSFADFQFNPHGPCLEDRAEA